MYYKPRQKSPFIREYVSGLLTSNTFLKMRIISYLKEHFETRYIDIECPVVNNIAKNMMLLNLILMLMMLKKRNIKK